jgi:hypothetical protein
MTLTYTAVGQLLHFYKCTSIRESARPLQIQTIIPHETRRFAPSHPASPPSTVTASLLILYIVKYAMDVAKNAINKLLTAFLSVRGVWAFLIFLKYAFEEKPTETRTISTR